VPPLIDALGKKRRSMGLAQMTSENIALQAAQLNSGITGIIYSRRQSNYTQYRVAKNSKALPSYQKIVLNRIKACQRDYVSSSN